MQEGTKKYSSRAIDCNLLDTTSINDLLKEYNSEGWRMISMVASNIVEGMGIMVFEKEQE